MMARAPPYQLSATGGLEDSRVLHSQLGAGPDASLLAFSALRPVALTNSRSGAQSRNAYAARGIFALSFGSSEPRYDRASSARLGWATPTVPTGNPARNLDIDRSESDAFQVQGLDGDADQPGAASRRPLMPGRGGASRRSERP